MLPLIGITVDNRDNSLDSGKYDSAVAYSRAVAAAGGLPLLLPQELALAPRYVELCDGILLTGGADPTMESFGVPTHPQARCISPQRQAFELALLDALSINPGRPALGVCLGMQLMALHAHGSLNQFLPETLAQPEVHQKDNRHGLVLHVRDSALLFQPDPLTQSLPNPAHETVVSWHRQAVEKTGGLRLVATAPDGVVEAIDDPSRRFYLGVQWHPERGGNGLFNAQLLAGFVNSCRNARSG